MESQTLQVEATSQTEDTEIISVEECKKYLGKYQLSDKRIVEIRDNITGIVDNLLNSYLKDLR
jgi:hypothetical protein